MLDTPTETVLFETLTSSLVEELAKYKSTPLVLANIASRDMLTFRSCNLANSMQAL